MSQLKGKSCCSCASLCIKSDCGSNNRSPADSADVEQFRNTEIIRSRRQIPLIEYPIHNNNESFKKKCQDPFTIMEQTAVQKNHITSTTVLLLSEFTFPMYILYFSPPIFKIQALKIHIMKGSLQNLHK